ncbi:MAG: aa3-type cytochrome c oxidase subunit IV [Sphingomonadaceae bacterium]
MASGNDMKAHTATYEGFLSLAKWGIIAAALVTAFIIYMISK